MLISRISGITEHIIYICIVILITSCAQIVPPTGGPKDDTPPKVVLSTPENFSTNFKAKNINIEFDEYIQVKNVSTELLISPPIEETPDIEARNKTLIVKFEESLKDSTTYTINFGNAVVDLNESNPFENFKYILSTGNTIDSLTVSGKILDAFDLKPQKDVLVFLYNMNNDTFPYVDSMPMKILPSYYAKTNDNGIFEINYIKDGSYKMFALKEQNSNMLFDDIEEAIAFSTDKVIPYYKTIQLRNVINDTTSDDSLVDSISKSEAIDSSELKIATINDTINNITSGKNDLTLYLFKENKRIQKIKSIDLKSHKLTIAFNKSFENLELNPISDSLSAFYKIKEVSNNKDSVVLWLDETISDSMMFAVICDTSTLDTIKLENYFKLVRNKKEVKDTILKVSSNIKSNILEKNGNLTLLFSEPVKDIDLSKMFLVTQTDTLNAAKYILDSLNNGKLSIINSWDSLKEYNLYIYPNAFTDIYGLTNDTVITKFKIRESNYYGTINLDFVVVDSNYNYIIQLLDEKNNVITEKTINKSGIMVFGYIPAGKYRYKIIYDKNNNNKWDTGDYMNKLYPEKITYYKNVIDVRSDWETDILWKLNE